MVLARGGVGRPVGPAWFQRWWFGRQAGPDGGAAEAGRGEHLVSLAFGLIRTATLAELSVAAGLGWGSFRYPAAIAAVLGASAAESAAVIEASRRRGRLGGAGVVALDVGLTITGLIVTVVALKPSADPYLDNVYYPYSVASMALAGLALRRLPGVVAVPTLVAAVYAAATVAGFEFQVVLLMNMATYWVLPLVGWTLARTLQRHVELVRERESARHAEELHGAQLAAAQAEAQRLRERAQTFAQLHNHVLQDLEFLAREQVLDDERVRTRVAADAAWLRRLLDGAADGGPGRLETALADVTLRREQAGLRVELNVAGLDDMPDGLLTGEAVRALADAVDEALANVAEHAGTGRAFVRAVCSDDGVTVTVVDRGRGFDPGQVPGGHGISLVIRTRADQVGGRAVITSRVGDGTRVELTVPARRPVPPPRGPDPDEARSSREPGT